MASSTTPAAPGSTMPGGTIVSLPSTGTGVVAEGTEASGSGETVPAGCIANALSATFNIPHGIQLPLFDGSDWTH